MARGLKSVDIGDAPDLIRLAEEVRDSNEPRVLRRDGEILAILIPVVRRRRRVAGARKRVDLEAFRSAAGSWRDVDIDRFLTDTYESRRDATRPPADL